ncbi:MAG: DUF167 domain-containing protein [Acidobacteria bacterium]|nr:DUF167 domain-containing protein [Acidobacteriota bacterium]
MSLEIQSRAGGVRFGVKVQARAQRDEIVEVREGRLRVRVTAPPVEGRANEALIRLLAAHLRVPKSSIKIAAGERSPLKVVEVSGLDAATMRDRLRL